MDNDKAVVKDYLTTEQKAKEFNQAMSDHLDWMQSPRRRAFLKAHPISKKTVLKRLKERRK